MGQIPGSTYAIIKMSLITVEVIILCVINIPTIKGR